MVGDNIVVNTMNDYIIVGHLSFRHFIVTFTIVTSNIVTFIIVDFSFNYIFCYF